MLAKAACLFVAAIVCPGIAVAASVTLTGISNGACACYLLREVPQIPFAPGQEVEFTIAGTAQLQHLYGGTLREDGVRSVPGYIGAVFSIAFGTGSPPPFEVRTPYVRTTFFDSGLSGGSLVARETVASTFRLSFAEAIAAGLFGDGTTPMEMEASISGSTDVDTPRGNDGFSDGTLTIQSVTPIPLPPSAALFACVLALAGSTRLARRR